MPEDLEQSIRRLAANKCEYCRMPESASRLPHVLDHIIARQHLGKTEFANLALCCGRCNLHKGPNLSGIDPETGQIVPLFHPRNATWTDHFRYDGPLLAGLTPSGRATLAVLAINDPLRVAARQALMDIGIAF